MNDEFPGWSLLFVFLVLAAVFWATEKKEQREQAEAIIQEAR